MVTFTDLRDARAGSLRQAAQTWGKLAATLAELQEGTATDLTGPLRASGWHGEAATQAFFQMDQLDDEFEVAALQVRTAASVLRQAADDIIGLQQRLDGAVDAAAGLGLRVDDVGRVTSPDMGWAERHDPDGQLAHRRDVENAGIYTDVIVGILAEATQSDNLVTRALTSLKAAMPGQHAWEYNKVTAGAQAAAAGLGLSENAIPGAGTAPAAVKRWWNSLSADDRQVYLTAYPDRLGGLDGLPAAHRDYANQLALRTFIGENVNTYRDHQNAQYDRALMLLEKLENAEHGPEHKRLYLLSVEPVGDGKAAVAVGNPDTADRTAVLVPGVGTELDGIRGLIARASGIQDSAMELAPSKDVAVVAWLGYDTPSLDGDIVTAVAGDKSRAGAHALDGFVNGLHAAYAGGGPDHVTAIGHSYGSTVLGEAASTGDGLAVNDIVAVGSPGMRVEHADAFNVATDHVWAGAAPDDNFVARPENAAAKIPIIGDLIGGAANQNIHGPGPHYPAFGGNVLTIDTHGHSGYWDADSVSLQSQAAIVLGDYELAHLDYGKAPPS